ncbi:MAG TPA: hypothetical protein VLE69_01680 [Candidatus Saccharimonadales bacterium]|nr:hypothetical protein [Candidatus Saccharimonadales bacterium]
MPETGEHSSEHTFEDAFGFRAPSDPEVMERIVEVASLKFSKEGTEPTATLAFMSNPGMAGLLETFVEEASRPLSEEFGIDADVAHMLVLTGFYGALEIISTVRLASTND